MVRLFSMVAALAVLAVAALDADADRAPCAVPHGSHVIAKTKRAVVIRRDRRPRHVHACLFSADHMVRLSGHSPIYRLAGRYVAYRDYFGDESRGGRTYDVDVADLGREGRLLDAPAAYSNISTSDDGTVPATITDLTLKANGSVAFISCRTGRGPDSPCRPALRRQVWRADLRGHAVLDKSRRIGPYSLRRHGSTISWRHGAKRRHGRLK
jgi:hypothetical protein